MERPSSLKLARLSVHFCFPMPLLACYLCWSKIVPYSQKFLTTQIPCDKAWHFRYAHPMRRVKKCPYCTKKNPLAPCRVVKRGSFRRKMDHKKIQRYSCCECHRSFSDQTFSDTYRLRKLLRLRTIEKLQTSGVSKRRTALLLKTGRRTLERRISLLALRAKAWQDKLIKGMKNKYDNIQFDDVETFEHTKMKPLSIALAVVDKKRLILSAQVNRMPAKGLLAEKSRKKYGQRADERYLGWKEVLKVVKTVAKPAAVVLSDENPHYPKYICEAFPHGTHRTVPGGRGCIAGYGELKKKGFDPMFSLNHTAAMLRDNIACLKRRTWTTTKKPEKLQELLHIYIKAHNSRILQTLNSAS